MKNALAALFVSIVISFAFTFIGCDESVHVEEFDTSSDAIDQSSYTDTVEDGEDLETQDDSEAFYCADNLWNIPSDLVCDGNIDCPDGSDEALDTCVDNEQDGTPRFHDNCKEVHNTLQSDMDNDGVGDACDDDLDGDGVLNQDDICPFDGMSNTCDDYVITWCYSQETLDFFEGPDDSTVVISWPGTDRIATPEKIVNEPCFVSLAPKSITQIKVQVIWEFYWGITAAAPIASAFVDGIEAQVVEDYTILIP